MTTKIKLSIESCLEQALNYEDGILHRTYNKSGIHAGVNIFNTNQDVSTLEVNIYDDNTDIKLARIIGKYYNKYKYFEFKLPKQFFVENIGWFPEPQIKRKVY